jgi:hypothetical protein
VHAFEIGVNGESDGVGSEVLDGVVARGDFVADELALLVEEEREDRGFDGGGGGVSCGARLGVEDVEFVG